MSEWQRIELKQQSLSPRGFLLFDTTPWTLRLFQRINEPRQTCFVVCCPVSVDDAFGGKLIKQLRSLAQFNKGLILFGY
jgi:hypothetical protein